MLRKIFAILALGAISTSNAYACDAICTQLKRAMESAPYRDSSHGPSRGQVCVTLDQADPTDEIVLAINYGATKPIYTTRWRKGAALASGGTLKVPMICFDQNLLNGATHLGVCNNVALAVLASEKVAHLQRHKANPPGKHVCLRGSACPPR